MTAGNAYDVFRGTADRTLRLATLNAYYDDYYPYYDYAYAYYGDGGCYVLQRRVHTGMAGVFCRVAPEAYNTVAVVLFGNRRALAVN
jgi:hypothetical protein